MRCSRKARRLIPLSSIGEVAHFAIRANLHIDALTMLKDAWQCIVGCCVPCFFSCVFFVVSSHIMLPWRNRSEESKHFLWPRIFDCTWVDLSDLFSFRLFWVFLSFYLSGRSQRALIFYVCKDRERHFKSSKRISHL